MKRLAGNPGKRKLPKTGPKPAQTTPEMPTWMRGEARKEWKRIVPELDALGLLAKVDLAVLAMYCAAWGRYCEAEKKLKRHGMTMVSPSGYEQKSPFLTIADKALDQVRRLATELGLSPAARNRVVAEPKEDDDDFFAVRK
ncbi:MAG TPA: phage terminase small subunit P27 family [Longimicrobiales bacterium]